MGATFDMPMTWEGVAAIACAALLVVLVVWVAWRWDTK